MQESSTPRDRSNDIAIVGMSVHFPGAADHRAYWKNLQDGVESIQQLTEEELLAAGVPPRALKNPAYVRSAAFLEGMEDFDPEFFGFSPKEGAILDPQHRHFLERCWESLEDAGYAPNGVEGSVGVFAGCGMGAYFAFNLLTNPELVRSVGLFLLRHTGNDKDFLATRASYCLDLKGPSIAVQTACSTSLVAAHAACQSLLSHECDMALAGGSTIELPHKRGYLYEEGEILSPDGHCRTFDAASKGTVFGSGSGVVVLRRYDDAVEKGDHIYAVIRGSAVNNDGAGKVGYLAPSVDGQAGAAVEALAIAGVEAGQLDYVECHGTGTPVGDPIEIAALTQAFRETTDAKNFCGVGSVKSNIGHLDTAAGVAALTKAALALKHGKIPPTLHFSSPNPGIDFETSPFYVNTSLTDFPTDKPMIAGVNSLGVGGTNAFAVLEAAPRRAPSSAATRPGQLIVLSGRSKAAVDDMGKRLGSFLREDSVTPLADVAFTLLKGRTKFDVRRVFAARDRDHAIELLEAKDSQQVYTRSKGPEGGDVAFLLPGGGAQYPRMGADLYDSEPSFRKDVDRGLELLDGTLDVDLRSIWFAAEGSQEEASQAFQRPSVQLPAIFILEYALARLWMSWGIKPTALLGHSMGENTAACLAGVMTFEECLDLVRVRGQLFERVPEGGMLSVSSSEELIRPLLPSSLDLGVVNGPSLCVVSGPVGPLVQFAETLAERDIDARRIPISIAAHSSLLDEILGEFEAQVRTIDLKKPTIPFLSNLTGTWITDDEATSAKYWVGHLRGTVQYSRCAETLLASSAATFLEVGPGRTLSSLMKQQAGFKGSAVAISSVRHPDESANDGLFFMAALGQLWAAGQPLNDEVLWPGETRHRVSMPTYPFQRQRYWIEPGAGSSAAGDDEGPSIPERSDDIGAWGFTPKWTPSTLPSGQFEERSVWLIFVDGTDIGVTIAAHLKALGHVVIEVRESDAYYQASDTRFSLSPEHGRDGYDALVKDLIATGNVPSRVLHLWQLTADESFRPGSSFFHRNLERGFYSLFFLAQALGQEGVKTPMHWTIASNGMHSVLGETLRYPEKAMALGPCRVVPREFTNITCASVDVDLPDLSAKRFGSKRILNESTARIAQQLQGEIAQPGANATVAYRDGKRYSESMVPQELLTASAPEHGGTFLITGGLGGIGGRIARHLAETQKASLVLVGRSTLPPREEWDRHLRSHGLAEARSRSITLIRSLEESGSRVLATDGDVADLERMEEIVTRATADFGPIDCVIHTAGVLRDDLILSKSYSSVEEVFAPKVHGTQVLGEVFRDRDLPLMVLFSSTSTVTAPAGQVDYVAANAFLNAFASAQNGKLARRVIALNWGIWADVGMAAKLGRKMSLGEAPQERSEPRPAEHPLLDVRIDDEHGTTFESVFSPDTHWVFDEHRTADGQALLPGTAFVEMIRASAAELGGESPFEIRDLFFFRPLAIADGVKRRVRCTLRTSDEGYDFEAQSWCETPDGTTGWERHVQARIVLRPVPRAGALDIPAIAQRCEFDSHQDDPSGIVTGQERFLKFGPRWRVLRAQAYGDGEALGRLRLDDTFASDHDSYWLPPGLLDIATGFAMPLLKGYGASEDLWVPVNYRQIAVHSPLPKDVYSWVRLTANDTESDIATFDILLTDNGGKVALEVSGFTIKRLAKNQVFAAARPPLPSELVPVDSPSAVTRNLSDAELGFQQQLEHGIRGDEGMEALDRVLREDASSVRYVSSMNLNELIQHVDHSARRTSASDTAKFSRPELDSEFIEPENEIERTLVGFWEELLGVDRVGALDSFFDLGGHSLIAVRLFAKVKKAYHVDLPISVLFEAPNVRSCARLIHDQIGTDEERQSRSESKQTRFDHLVPMHPSNPGDGTPFFLVAGMFGNVLNLRHLAHLVGTSRPFYGLQARGLYGGHKPHESFEEMATDYLAEIRAVQPHGPYLLGGFSGGGITAFEIAQQLRSSGEEVALLAFLDTPLAHAEPLSSVDKATIHLQRLTRHGPAYAVNWMKNRVKWEVGRFRERFEGEASQDDGAQEESNFHSEEIEAAFRRSLERYEPKHYPGAVHLFRPRLDEAHRLGSNRVANSERQIVWADNGWTPLVDALHVSEVPGDHDSMVLEPNVRVLASRIRRCIEQVSANGAENRMEASAPVEAHA